MAGEDLGSNVSKEYRDRFVKGAAIGEVGAAIGSGIGGYVGDTFFRGNRFARVLTGGICGDYLVGSLFDGIYWYNANREAYKGFSGKLRFIKDEVGFHARSIPATIASYAAYAPIGAALLALGAPAVAATVVASVLSSAIYILGSFFLNKGYLRKVEEEHASSKAKYSSPAPSGSS
ncbi:hypothetical protein J4209_02330 [Candidatus Woesearchaeota archaeon]|nr:hypothetical protein [Candidatus Woesearchaeota archaeon]